MQSLKEFNLLPTDKKVRRPLIVLLLSAFFLRLLLSGLPGFVGDTDNMVNYVRNAAKTGLTGVTDTEVDVLYPPVFVYQAIAGSVVINTISGHHPLTLESRVTSWERMGVRLGPILSDICIGAVLFLAVHRWRPGGSAITASAVYLFNPGTIANSALWNYDAVPSLLILLSLLVSVLAFQNKRSGWLIGASVIAALAFCSKLQAGMYVPIFGLFILLTLDFRVMAKCALAFLVITTLAYLPFMVEHRWDYLKKVFPNSFEAYPTTHFGSFNTWALWYQIPVSTRVLGITLETFGRVAYLGVAALGAYSLWKSNHNSQSDRSVATPWQWGEDSCRRLTIVSAYLCFAPFMLLTRMHERYLAPAIAITVLAGFLDPRLRKISWGLSITYALNMIAVYFIVCKPWANPGEPVHEFRFVHLGFIGIRVLCSSVNVFLFIWFTTILRRTLANPPNYPDRSSVLSVGAQPNLAPARSVKTSYSAIETSAKI